MSADLCYVYAVTPPLLEPLSGEVRGVADGVPYALAHDGLTAVVSKVPAGDFGAGALAVHEEDTGWLSRTAREHRAVVDALAAVTCPLPVRLGTVLADEEEVRGMLDARRPGLLRTLERLDGRVEWDVQVYADSPPDEVTARENVRDDSEQLTMALHAALSRQAEDVRVHPTGPPGPLDGHGPSLLHAGYLVPRERSGEFLALLDQLAAPDPTVRAEVTGPRAPYAFAEQREPQAQHGP